MQNPILQRLFDHNLHATQTLLTVCAELNPNELDREFPIGLGSLRQTLAHVVGCIRRWTDRSAERPLRPSIEAPSTDQPPAPVHSLQELQQLLLDADADLRTIATELENEERLEEFMNFVDEDVETTYRFSRATVIVHLMTHGVHHRAQALNML